LQAEQPLWVALLFCLFQEKEKIAEPHPPHSSNGSMRLIALFTLKKNYAGTGYRCT
jgi:hypothetical protein